jgi:hypothetical protein
VWVSSYLLREAPVSVLTKSFLGGSLDVSLSLVLQISKSRNLDFGTLFQIQEPWDLGSKIGSSFMYIAYTLFKIGICTGTHSFTIK